MKAILSFIVCLFPGFIYAQLSMSGYALQKIGYETNPLRIPSNRLLIEEDDDLLLVELPSAFTTNTKIYLSAKQKWKKAEFGLRPRVDYSLYPGYEEANYLKGDVTQLFSFKVNKKWKLYQSTFWSIRQRNGDSQDEEAFVIPLSYSRFKSSIGAERKLANRWAIKLDGAYLKQIYNAQEDRINQYTAWEINTEIKKRFKKASKWKEIEWEVYWQNRNWTRAILQNDSTEIWSTSITPMQYFRVSWTGIYKLGKNMEWKPLLQYATRNSKIARQSWSSLRAGLGFNWSKDNWQVKWSGSIYNRKFPQSFNEDYDDLALNFLYIRNSLTVEQFFTDQISALFTMQLNQRTSNYLEEEEPAVGAYHNAYIGLGGKVRF